MAYATPTELATYMQLPSVDTASALLLLELVSDAVEQHASVFDLNNPPTALKAVTLQAAARAYANPVGVQQETIGSESWTYGGVGGVLTDAEITRVRRATGVVPRRAASVRLIPGP